MAKLIFGDVMMIFTTAQDVLNAAKHGVCIVKCAKFSATTGNHQNVMIKIKTILNHGGICPFQIDALTDDGRMIYGRYRWGRLAVYVGQIGDLSEYAGVNGELIFWNSKLGSSLDGCMSLEEFKDHTKETLDFSEAVIDG